MNTFFKTAVVLLLLGALLTGISQAANIPTPAKQASKADILAPSDPANVPANPDILPTPKPQTYLEIVLGGGILLVLIQRRKNKLT